MTELNRINKNTKSLNDIPLHERMEYQRVHDRAVILQASMKGTAVELKTLGEKRNPFALENIRSD